jgi:aminoglycoside 6'-N-acetyltransferase
MADELIRHNDLTLRLMRDDIADYQIMARWLTDARVLEFYEGRDNAFPLERIIEKYTPRVLQQDRVTPCFITYHDAPIGYAQYYLVTDGDKHELGYATDDDVTNMIGIDLFIGEPALWNKGIGTRAVTLLLAYLFDTLHATKVVLDPETWNERAIRCYEKCGFRKVRILPQHEMHEGAYRDSWLMEIAHEEFDARR